MSNMDTVDDVDLWSNTLEYLEDQLDYKSPFQVLPDSVNNLDLWYDAMDYFEVQMDCKSQFPVLTDPKPEPVHFPVPEPELELDPVTLPVHDNWSSLKREKVLKAVEDVVKALEEEPLDDYVSEDLESLPEPKMVDLALATESEGIDTKDNALLTEIHKDIVHFVNKFDWQTSESNSDDDLGAPHLDSEFQKLREILPGTMDAETVLEQTPRKGNEPMTKTEVPKPKMASDVCADTKPKINGAASAPMGCKSPKVEPRHKPLVVQPHHEPTPGQKYSKQKHFSQPAGNQTVPVQHSRQPVGNQTVPVQHSRQPVGNQTVPAQHSGQPVGNQTVPVQHSRQPVGNRTVHAQHSRQPVGNQTVPAQHSGQPVANRTVPAQHSGQPVGNQTVPAQHCRQPEANQTVPAQHSRQPVGNQTVPAQHSRQPEAKRTVPAQHSGQPEAKRTVPAQHSGLPVGNQTVPAQHCRQPEANQTVPAQHSGQPVGNQTVPAQHCRQPEAKRTVPAQHSGQPVGNQTVPAQHCRQPEHGHYQQYQQYQKPFHAQYYQHYSGPVHPQHCHGPVYYHQPVLMKPYGQPVYDQRLQYLQYGQPVYDQRAQYLQYGHGHPNQAQYVPPQFAVPQQPAPDPAAPTPTVASQLVTPNQPTNNKSEQKESNKRKRATDEATASVIEAPSAFSMFKDEQWFSAKRELNTTDNAEVNAALEQRWRSLSQEKQAKYHNQAQQARRILEEFNPELCPVTAPRAESVLPKCNKRQRTIPSAASEFGLGRGAWTKKKAKAMLCQKDELDSF